MRLTIEHYHMKVVIEVDHDDLDISGVVDMLVRPALLAVGYHPDTVAECFFSDAEAVEEEDSA